MENNESETLRYAYESAMTRNHHVIRWLIIVIVLLILSLVGSNLAWVLYETQYDDYVETVTQDTADGDNNYIGQDGVIINK